MMIKLLSLLALLASARALTNVQEQVEETVEQVADLGLAPTTKDWVIPRSGYSGKGEHGHGDWKETKHCGHRPCNVCPVESENFVIVNTEVPRCEAEGVCARLGMELANVNSENFDDAAKLAFKCSGANSQTWINSWNTDEYKGTCIAFSTGSTCGGGAINVPKCCSERLPVMCQKKCHHHHHRHEHKHRECKDHHCHEESTSSSTTTEESSSSESSCKEHHHHRHESDSESEHEGNHEHGHECRKRECHRQCHHHHHHHRQFPSLLAGPTHGLWPKEHNHHHQCRSCCRRSRNCCHRKCCRRDCHRRRCDCHPLYQHHEGAWNSNNNNN